MVNTISALSFAIAAMGIASTSAIPMPGDTDASLEARKFSLGKIWHKAAPIVKDVGRIGLDIALRDVEEHAILARDAGDADIKAREVEELDARRFSLGKIWHKAAPIVKDVGRIGLDIALRDVEEDAILARDAGDADIEAREVEELDARKFSFGKFWHKAAPIVKDVGRIGLDIALRDIGEELAVREEVDLAVRKEDTLEDMMKREGEIDAREANPGKLHLFGDFLHLGKDIYHTVKG